MLGETQNRFSLTHAALSTGSRAKNKFLLVSSVTIGLAALPLTATAAAPFVVAGFSADSSFLIDGSGALYAWGYNSFGQLGLNGYNAQTTPSLVPYPSGVQSWKSLATGSGFSGGWTLAIADNNQLYGAGSTGLPVFSLITNPEGVGWTEAAVGESGYLALTANGSLYGTQGSGPLHYPQSPNGLPWQHVAFGETEILTIAADGRLYSGNVNLSSPPLVEVPWPPGVTAWTNVSGGAQFAMALANTGQLYAWGVNVVGQLGIGSSLPQTNVPQLVTLPVGEAGWKSVSCGQWHTLALAASGQVYVWGYNNYGQLGLGDTGSRFSPTKVPGLTNISAIAAGFKHSLASGDCKVWSWGRNTSGQLGLGFASAYWPSPQPALFSGDICATGAPQLPVVSITTLDDRASEGTWRSRPGHPATNTASFQVSRSIATNSPLVVYYQVSGTASNGVDYVSLPGSLTIAANTNSASTLIVPTQSILATDPATISLSLVPDASYLLGSPTNVVISLAQYESIPTPPMLTFDLFVGTTHEGEAFSILSSTNLTDWTQVGVGTNTYGIVSFVETNTAQYKQRFFSARLLSGN